MKIRYKTTLDDVLKLASYHYSISPKLQQSLRMARYISVVLFVLMAAVALFMRSTDLAFLALIFAIGYFFFIGVSHRKRYLKNFTKMYERSPKQGQVGTHQLSFNDIGVTDESENTRGTTSWKDIKHIESTPDYTFVYVGPVSAYVIPRLGVIEGDYKSFVAEMLQHYKKSRQ